MLTLFFFCLLAGTHATLLQINQPRIVNGEIAQPGEIPYQVSLAFKSFGHFCGGSILNEYYVITAAHCIYGKRTTDYVVVSGTVDLLNPHSVHEVDKATYHPDFNRGGLRACDIALIKVKTPIKKSELVDFVNLPEANEPVQTGIAAVVSGYGRLKRTGPLSRFLRFVKIFIADQSYCERMYKKIGSYIFDTQICANDPSVKKGSCTGDSGGPLVTNGKLIGIVSWSMPCSRTDYPTVYTRIPSFINWIKHHMI